MLKKLLTFFLAAYTALAFAAVDANKATSAELTEVKGIGPATATRIIDARKQGPFKNWDDLIAGRPSSHRPTKAPPKPKPPPRIHPQQSPHKLQAKKQKRCEFLIYA